jgi:hypothetical protein
MVVNEAVTDRVEHHQVTLPCLKRQHDGLLGSSVAGEARRCGP